MECNKMISIMLSGKTGCSENLFGIFCLFANRLAKFDDVLRVAEKENINFIQMIEDNGLNVELIIKGQ